ncbi:MAG: glycosyltransferase [Bacteroides sp.]|nr:glycosyltransferase [Bacteroides sp.]
MSFSVLMSLYHKERPDYLRQSLDSVFNQTHLPNEVIMVEDGPLTKDLYDILDEYESKYSQLKRVPLAINGGLGRALNEGLRHCSNELVARMDTDDVCFPERFEKQIKFMTANPQIDISSGWIAEFQDDISNVRSMRKVPQSHEEIANYIKSRNPLNHPCVIFRKKAVERVNGYQHFPLFEDWYLWARMIKNGALFANLQTPLLYFRTSSEMFRRRGGFKYAKDSASFQWTLHKLGLISTFSAIKSSLIRGTVYVMPNSIRALIYSKLLR